jgi:1-pyrroline-5-carboxylate dehydrogenase
MSLLNNSIIRVPEPVNEPQLDYAVDSEPRKQLKAALAQLTTVQLEIPLIIDGREVKTGNMGHIVMPHNHRHKLANYHQAGEREVRMAIESAMDAKAQWQVLRWEERAAIFLKAAELISGKYRFQLNAASMLSTSKNAHQAEIDAACEMIDFLRFNVFFAQTIYAEQPLYSSKGIWNFTQYRPLEGFVLAVAPFNFTAIAGNLAAAPAIMGNTVILKPASSCVYTPWLLMQIFKEAGLPDGVINFLPGPGSLVGDICLASPYLGGVHFTGSTTVFRHIWKTIGNNIDTYQSYPRIVGETGGKDFIFAHGSADVQKLAVACIRGAFEFQGQKCSAASRAYIPKSLWPQVLAILKDQMNRIKIGPVTDFSNFVNAVIDRNAFETIRAYIEDARRSNDAEIIFGGHCDDSRGYFIEPTIILTTSPKFKTMQEEIFGPVLTIYIYPDESYQEALRSCDQTSIYALTGAIFAKDRLAISQAMDALENAAGNFYINDKPTGAVVGQQPFGGARASGTNDKAGAANNLMRWVSARTVKEDFDSAEQFDYPFMKTK